VSVLGIDHAGITVASIKAALVFYRDLLGLTVTDEGEDAGPELDAISGLTGVRMRYAELDLGGGRLLEVMEFLPPEGRALVQSPIDPGASHLALRVDDVDALCARLAAAGVTVRGTPTTITTPGVWQGARCVYIEDPDGRTVELVQRTEQHQSRSER
jgi:catechol 2,3-dioxygenase-like lactoylglutathione lyase family enzyme